MIIKVIEYFIIILSLKINKYFKNIKNAKKFIFKIRLDLMGLV